MPNPLYSKKYPFWGCDLEVQDYTDEEIVPFTALKSAKAGGASMAETVPVVILERKKREDFLVTTVIEAFQAEMKRDHETKEAAKRAFCEAWNKPAGPDAVAVWIGTVCQRVAAFFEG